MGDVFHEPVSGSEKNRCCSHANGERQFGTNGMSNAAGFPGLGRRFHLFRHGREHIDSALVMQSA
jgi:hypothetical protein